MLYVYAMNKKMEKTVYISDDLGQAVENYLKEHPEETLSSIVQEAIQKKLAAANVSGFLSLAGLVEDAPCNARDRAEDFDVESEDKP